MENKEKEYEYNFDEVQTQLNQNNGFEIFCELSYASELVRNKKAIRIFDETENTSEVFFDKSQKFSAPMVYDFKEKKAYCAVNAYALKQGIKIYEAVICLGKKYNLIRHDYMTQYEYTKPEKPKVVITEKEQRKGVTQIQNLCFEPLQGKYLDFWAKYGVSIDYLQKCKIQALKSFEIVDTENGNVKKTVEPKIAFSYEVESEVYKIYQPFADKKYKWSWSCKKENNKPQNIVNYLEFLPIDCTMVLIVEGLKDCLVVNANFNKFGIYAVGLDSASTKISKKVLQDLAKHSQKVVLCLDNDKTGKEQNEMKHKETGLPFLEYLPKFEGCKDFADLIEKQPKETVLQWIQSDEYELTMKQRELLKRLDKYLIDINAPDINEPFCLTYYSSEEKREYKIASYNNIITITGKAKSRKSTFLSTLIASTIGNKNILGFRLCSYDDKIIYLDTEQSEISAKNTIKKIYAGGEKKQNQIDYFKAYRLRVFDIEERNEMLEALFLREKPKILVLDGIADFVCDINLLSECQKFVTKLLFLCDKYNCLIICVIHLNKDSNTMRGHLGTILMNKSQAIISVEKDGANKNQSIISILELRNDAPISENITFSINDFGEVIAEGTNQKEAKCSPIDTLKNRINETFNQLGAKKVTRKDFSYRFCSLFDLKPETAKKQITQAVANGLLLEEGANNREKTLHQIN